jgi:two-component system cell cycle response regulator DivK
VQVLPRAVFGSRPPAGGRPPSAPPGAASERDERAEASNGPLILVVDDFADNRELYAATFADAGYQVEEAENGQEALDFIERRRPAAVVMDLSMPVLDGWEATRRIKANANTAGIVVIAVTGHATHFGIQRAKEAGADIVVAKPCLPQDLLAALRTLTSTKV